MSDSTHCKECGCETGGGEYCYQHAPYLVRPLKDGSFYSDRNGRKCVWIHEPPSLESESGGVAEIVRAVTHVPSDSPAAPPDPWKPIRGSVVYTEDEIRVWQVNRLPTMLNDEKSSGSYGFMPVYSQTARSFACQIDYLLGLLATERQSHLGVVAEWMIGLSLVTGHGDTVADLLADAAQQVTVERQSHVAHTRGLQDQIAELHDIVSGYDAITDPEEQPELHERAFKALGDDADHTICRALTTAEADLTAARAEIAEQDAQMVRLLGEHAAEIARLTESETTLKTQFSQMAIKIWRESSTVGYDVCIGLVCEAEDALRRSAAKDADLAALRAVHAHLREELESHLALMEEHLDNEKFFRGLRRAGAAAAGQPYDDSDETPMPHIRVFEDQIVALRAALAASSAPQEPTKP